MPATTREKVMMAILVVLIAVIGSLYFSEHQRWQMENAYKAAVKQDTLEGYNNFISRYPGTARAIELVYYRDKKEFQDALKLNTMESFQSFLDSRPHSAWYDKAIYYRDREALVRAEKKYDLGALVTFIKTYPDSVWIPHAEFLLRDQFGVHSLSEAEERLSVFR